MNTVGPTAPAGAATTAGSAVIKSVSPASSEIRRFVLSRMVSPPWLDTLRSRVM